MSSLCFPTLFPVFLSALRNHLSDLPACKSRETTPEGYRIDYVCWKGQQPSNPAAWPVHSWPNQSMLLKALSKHLLHTGSSGSLITFLEVCCSVWPSSQKCSPVSSLSLLWCSFELFLWTLSVDTREKGSAPPSPLPLLQRAMGWPLILLFSKLEKHKVLTCSSQDIPSSPFTGFLILWTHSRIFLKLCGPELRAVLKVRQHQHWVQTDYHPFWWAVFAVFDANQHAQILAALQPLFYPFIFVPSIPWSQVQHPTKFHLAKFHLINDSPMLQSIYILPES